MGYVHSLTEYAYRDVRDERAGEKKRAYAPCEWKDTSAFSDSYVTNLRYKNALTNDTFRDIRFADEFRRDVRRVFLYICLRRLTDLLYVEWLRNLCRELKHSFLVNFHLTKKDFMRGEAVGTPFTQRLLLDKRVRQEMCYNIYIYMLFTA